MEIPDNNEIRKALDSLCDKHDSNVDNALWEAIDNYKEEYVKMLKSKDHNTGLVLMASDKINTLMDVFKSKVDGHETLNTLHDALHEYKQKWRSLARTVLMSRLWK